MEIKNEGKTMRKITAAAFLATAAVGVFLLINTIILDVIYVVGYNHEQSFEFDYIMVLLKSLISAIIPIAYRVFVTIMSVMLAVQLLKNKSETLLLRIFCIVNATYFAYLAIKGGLFNQITYFDDFFGNLNLMSVQRFVTAALLAAIAGFYSDVCSKAQANVLAVLSAAQYLIYTAFSVASVIYVVSSEIALTPIYSAVTSIIATVLMYLPLLLICIQKRIDSHKEEL